MSPSIQLGSHGRLGPIVLPTLVRMPLARSLRHLIAAAAVSAVGDGMVFVGFPLLALSYTRSAALVAGVAVASQVPGLFLTLPSGVLVDRSDRRRLMLAIEVTRFVLTGATVVLVFTGVARLWVVYAAAFLLGALTVLFNCAQSSVVPDMADPSQLVRANAGLQTAISVGEETAGRALGGLAFSVGRALPLLGDAVSFLGSGALLSLALPSSRRGKHFPVLRRPESPPRAGLAGMREDLVQGIRWYLRHPFLRFVSAMISQLAFCQAAVLAILVLYATSDLHLTSTGFGLVLAVSSIGNLIGAASAERIHLRLGSGLSIVIAAVLSAASYPVLALTHSAIAAGAALTLEAMAVMIGTTAAVALRHAAVPAPMQGRAGSAAMTFLMAATALGTLAGGLTASAIGLRETILAAGVLQLVLAAVTAPFLMRNLRRVIDLTDASQQGADALAPSRPRELTEAG